VDGREGPGAALPVAKIYSLLYLHTICLLLHMDMAKTYIVLSDGIRLFVSGLNG